MPTRSSRSETLDIEPIPPDTEPAIDTARHHRPTSSTVRTTTMIHYPFGVAGFTTRVLECGQGDDVMVLVHGVGARADRWVPAMERFAAAGFHVYALDLPGHGFAHKGPGPDYSVPGYARFLRAFLSEMGIDDRPRVLVGTSLGGHVSAMAVANEPELASALVLVGSIGLVPWGAERRAATRGRLGDVSEEGVRRKLSILVHDETLVTDDWVREEMMVNGSPGARESFEEIAAYIGERLDDDLVLESLVALEGRPPIQLVWGEEERAVPVEVGREAHAALPGSELYTMPGVAHAPYFEDADGFVAAVVDFVRRRRTT
jgi:2-hydroxy-6-oxonona-2,4-dienedioate hydrolase